MPKYKSTFQKYNLYIYFFNDKLIQYKFCLADNEKKTKEIHSISLNPTLSDLLSGPKFLEWLDACHRSNKFAHEFQSFYCST